MTEHDEQARKLADALRDMLPEHLGFTLFVFDYKDAGRCSYISTATRPTMISTIREWLTKVTS